MTPILLFELSSYLEYVRILDSKRIQLDGDIICLEVQTQNIKCSDTICIPELSSVLIESTMHTIRFLGARFINFRHQGTGLTGIILRLHYKVDSFQFQLVLQHLINLLVRQGMVLLVRRIIMEVKELH